MKSKFVFVIAAILFTITLLSFQGKPKFDLKASVVRGKDVYTAQCIACHMEQGEGIENVYPPLAKADYLKGDKNKLANKVLHGISGEMKVNNITYNGEMTTFDHL